MMWIYLLKRKSEVFLIFKKFKLMCKKQSGKAIKVIRKNGGGEYTSHEFKKYCDKEEMLHEVTTPYTSQHNGVAERMNITIMNMERSMLKGMKLPKYLGEKLC